ncbi:amidohydrolase [Lacihabitans sp. LS3-19]|uniref:amidohydrolase n=1 Tax=Lacihabitans sp. LS3-19 TaxID=2487335 RepID=UPI0020CBB459|nr:amidohydrolase [Lacihabitans sp. LS3-19]MCP9766641.1 amidohydrolase [Lacihabitans sp. LS3-19]
MKKLFILFLIAANVTVFSQTKQQVINDIQKRQAEYSSIAMDIWKYAEVGYQEYKSSELLQQTLKKEGFSVTAGVAEIPTAFVATFGSGKPVIGILGEFDALPGLSQAAKPEKESLNGVAGHACGHHLFGVGSAAAAIAVKDWMKKTGQKGTVKFYGTPAEEGGSGKVYMVRDGLFNGVDVVLHWHPGSGNSANASSSLANKSGKFRFYGRSAHAAASPENGRSALDGVEAMTHMINMMREHVQEDSRIHYVITSGGKAPNVVPDFAELYLYVRHPNRTNVKEMWEWMENIAQGAAQGTGTRVESEVLGGVYELLPNETLAKVMHSNMNKVGGYVLTPEEVAFANKILPTPGMFKSTLDATNTIEELKLESSANGGSTDVGDVSWAVPTVGCRTATWVPGTPAHSWQAVAAGGTNIGVKGMMIAAKTIALSAIDLFQNQELIDKATVEFKAKTGGDFKYESLLGDRKPALNYRN